MRISRLAAPLTVLLAGVFFKPVATDPTEKNAGFAALMAAMGMNDVKPKDANNAAKPSESTGPLKYFPMPQEFFYYLTNILDEKGVKCETLSPFRSTRYSSPPAERRRKTFVTTLYSLFCDHERTMRDDLDPELLYTSDYHTQPREVRNRVYSKNLQKRYPFGGGETINTLFQLLRPTDETWRRYKLTPTGIDLVDCIRRSQSASLTSTQREKLLQSLSTGCAGTVS